VFVNFDPALTDGEGAPVKLVEEKLQPSSP